MSWLNLSHAQHVMHELHARARVADIERNSANSALLAEAAGSAPQRRSLPRRILRRIRGGGD